MKKSRNRRASKKEKESRIRLSLRRKRRRKRRFSMKLSKDSKMSLRTLKKILLTKHFFMFSPRRKRRPSKNHRRYLQDMKVSRQVRDYWLNLSISCRP